MIKIIKSSFISEIFVNVLYCFSIFPYSFFAYTVTEMNEIKSGQRETYAQKTCIHKMLKVNVFNPIFRNLFIPKIIQVFLATNSLLLPKWECGAFFFLNKMGLKIRPINYVGRSRSAWIMLTLDAINRVDLFLVIFLT